MYNIYMKNKKLSKARQLILTAISALDFYF